MSCLIRFALLGCLVGAAWPAPAAACPFCSQQGETLVSEVALADFVIYGQLKDPKLAAGGEDGTTNLVVEAVIKAHPEVKDKKTIVIPRYLPDTGGDKYRYLVYCTMFKGKIDPFRGVAVRTGSDLPKYLKGALELRAKNAPVSERLRFAFNFLDNADAEVSSDAYKEFANATDEDLVAIAKDLPPERVVHWLKDKETPPYRVGLYGSILGHCGKPEHAAVLRTLLEDPERRFGGGVDGILAGYILLQPKEGWEYTPALLKDSKKDFLLRYAALRAVRYFHDVRKNILDAKELVDGVAQMLEDRSIADLAVEDLRKWHRWEFTDRVLGLEKKPVYQVPIVKRAVLRFALASEVEGSASARAFVEARRKENPKAVKDAEELLKLEQPSAK